MKRIAAVFLMAAACRAGPAPLRLGTTYTVQQSGALAVLESLWTGPAPLTTVVRGAGPVQSDSSTASAPDCCTVYVVPSRKGAGPARQAAAMRNTAAMRFMPGNMPYRECSSGCTFQESPHAPGREW